MQAGDDGNSTQGEVKDEDYWESDEGGCPSDVMFFQFEKILTIL